MTEPERRETLLASTAPRRVWVTGPPGAGKSTVSQELGRVLRVPHYELDAVFWGPNWTKRSDSEFRARVAKIASQERWVIDGHYTQAVDLVTSRLEAFVWLDAALPLTFLRLLRRTLAEIAGGQQLWNGNLSSWRNVVGRDSILLYALITNRRIRREARQICEELSARRLMCLRLTRIDAIRELFSKTRSSGTLDGTE